MVIVLSWHYSLWKVEGIDFRSPRLEVGPSFTSFHPSRIFPSPGCCLWKRTFWTARFSRWKISQVEDICKNVYWKMIEDSFESFEPKKGWPGHNGCALLTSCVSFQNFSLFLPPLTVVESLDWVVSDFSVVNAQRACYIGFHLFIFVDFWVVFAEIPSFIFVWKEDVKVVSLQGKTSLTKEDIATVFSLYDRVSCFTSCWVVNLWMI